MALSAALCFARLRLRTTSRTGKQTVLSKESFHQVVAIAAPNAGLYLAPTRCEETLHTNLLSLESCPPDIFIAETECRKPRGREVFASCTSNRSTSPDFVPGQFGFAARGPNSWETLRRRWIKALTTPLSLTGTGRGKSPNECLDSVLTLYGDHE